MNLPRKPESSTEFKKRTPARQLSAIGLTLSLLLGQPSHAKTIPNKQTYKIEQSQRINIEWIKNGIHSTSDIKKLNEIFENWNKLSFEQRMLVFNSLINQYKLIEQKIKNKSNKENFSINFINHLEKSPVDLAVIQALRKILGKYNGPINGKNIAEFQPIDEEDKNTIAIFVFKMKNIETEKLNLPKPYNLIPDYEDSWSESIFYIYLTTNYKKDSIILSTIWNLLPEETASNLFNPRSLCSDKPIKEASDIPERYEYCIEYKLRPEELNQFYNYAFKIADSLDELFEITKNREKFKGTILEK